jgi:hypothetical protein
MTGSVRAGKATSRTSTKSKSSSSVSHAHETRGQTNVLQVGGSGSTSADVVSVGEESGPDVRHGPGSQEEPESIDLAEHDDQLLFRDEFDDETGSTSASSRESVVRNMNSTSAVENSTSAAATSAAIETEGALQENRQSLQSGMIVIGEQTDRSERRSGHVSPHPDP